MYLLGDIAQNTMDQYYQTFKADEDFFSLYHFKYLNSIAYADLLQTYYDQNYKKNLIENGHGDVEFDPSWFIEEEVKLEKGDGDEFIGKTKQKPLSFMNDNRYRSIQDIVKHGKCDCDFKFVRITQIEVWKLRGRAVPASSYIFWYRLGDKISFKNVHCGLKEVKVWYMPSLCEMEDDLVVPEGLSKKIIEATLNLMFVSRQGGIINVSNDQNTNKTMESEISNIFRSLKNKG